MRKIAFFIYSLEQGGAERVTSILANQLVSRGINVTIFVMKSPSVQSYSLDQGVSVVDISADASLGSYRSGLIFNLRRLLVLRRLIVRLAPSMLFSMMTRANVIAALALSGTGIPCVGSERNDPGEHNVGRLWAILRKISYSRCHAVVAQTASAKMWLQQHTFARQVAVIPNPVQFPVASTVPFVSIPRSDGKMLLAVGRLCPQKQYSHLIEAFSQVSDEHPDWWLAIVGEGEGEEALREQIVKADLASRVHIAGRVGNIADWYARADLFVMTSLYEGYPNALVEAMVSAVPVVSYDCPSGPSDLIEHEVNGLLVPANKVEILGSSLRRIMTDTRLAHDFSVAGETIKKCHNADTILDQWLALAETKR